MGSNAVEILEMTKEEILTLKEEDVSEYLTPEQFVHISKLLECFWSYDYKAAKQGKVGMHAELKSKNHSEGFFASAILLGHENIFKIIAGQMARKIQKSGILNGTFPPYKPDWISGIPKGATKLGEEIADRLKIKCAKMEKNADGKIVLATKLIFPGTVLLIEDFCTKGTGFTEAVLEIKNRHPWVAVYCYNFCILNRGGLEAIIIETGNCEIMKSMIDFKIVPIVEYRIQEWNSEECPLCKMGSVPIKPKVNDENWHAITTSQL